MRFNFIHKLGPIPFQILLRKKDVINIPLQWVSYLAEPLTSFSRELELTQGHLEVQESRNLFSMGS